MDKLELMECTLADVKTLQAVSIETFSDTFGAQNTAENLQNYLEKAYNQQQLRHELTNPNSSFFFLKKANHIVGYLKLNTAEAQSEQVADNALEVERIYIRQAYLRQGYGNYLIKVAEIIARQQRKKAIWLGVWKHNANALAFYTKMGFTQIGAHSFYMGDDQQTDLILLKKLEELKK